MGASVPSTPSARRENTPSAWVTPSAQTRPASGLHSTTTKRNGAMVATTARPALCGCAALPSTLASSSFLSSLVTFLPALLLPLRAPLHAPSTPLLASSMSYTTPTPATPTTDATRTRHLPSAFASAGKHTTSCEGRRYLLRSPLINRVWC